VARARRKDDPIYSLASGRAVRARYCNDEVAAWARSMAVTRLAGRRHGPVGLANGERRPTGSACACAAWHQPAARVCHHASAQCPWRMLRTDGRGSASASGPNGGRDAGDA
jgi:hypothetical protein